MLSNHHISSMARTHPHAEATYQVISLPNCSFGVEVTIPDTYPIKVSGFATKAAAEAWITEHKRRVETNSGVNSGIYRSFRKASSPR